jgi:N-acetylglutamate synthase-like GNAT family acetyltransferase
MIKITETTDYSILIPFFIENDLEFEEGEVYGEDEIVKCWRADAYEKGRGAAAEEDVTVTHEPEGAGSLVGACILAIREGEYICDGIAVTPQLRKTGLGRELLDLLLDDARSRGADQVFLVARAPGFFATAGFIPIPRTEAPEFFECFTCPQYGKSCHPEVMRKDIGLRKFK